MPYYPDKNDYQVPDSISLSKQLTQIFAAHGILAQQLTNYEARDGQLAMAESIGKTLTTAGCASNAQYSENNTEILAETLIVEAGTGTGKTLAYLIPAVLSGQKIIISTNTINLQEQITTKEIPFIKKHIAPTLNGLCVKGRGNYLCLHRWQQLQADPRLNLFADNGETANINSWLAETKTGDRGELDWLLDHSPLWQTICSSASYCLGSHCPEAAGCFINKLRKQAAQAQILIVNHHLFFSDLALRRFGKAEVLPRYEAVIFDEAHHLENIATQYFGTSCSHYQLVDLAYDIETMANNELTAKTQQKTIQLARALAKQANQFITVFPQERGRFPLLAFIDNSSDWQTEYDAFTNQITALTTHLESLVVNSDIWLNMQRRSVSILDNLDLIVNEQSNYSVYWYEKREKSVVLSASPIDIAEELQKFLYSATGSVIFTSATLATSGNFNYFSKRLGLPPDAATMTMETHFDYAADTMLYVPDNNFPEPNQNNFTNKILSKIHELLKLSDGRALLLFTSINSMRNTYDFLKNKLDMTLLMQGEASKSSLLAHFQQDTHSILLAVASFWEGIDVPGHTLSCVIIDKIPFEVPSDPVIMARINRIKEEGGNPFIDFQIPRAILTLRQGIGRLLRSSTDKGLLAIMDVRLFTKGYGRHFLRSLPPSPTTRNLQDVATFFTTIKQEQYTTINSAL